MVRMMSTVALSIQRQTDRQTDRQTFMQVLQASVVQDHHMFHSFKAGRATHAYIIVVQHKNTHGLCAGVVLELMLRMSN